jgi:hypothetical protein
MMLRCRVFGHRYRFSATGAVMRWERQRDCGGSKTYSSPAAARRYASAFDREDRDQLGRRAPLFGMFPLRIWHKIHERKQQRWSQGQSLSRRPDTRHAHELFHAVGMGIGRRNGPGLD